MYFFLLYLAFITSVTEAASIGARACGTVTPAYAPTWFSGYSGKVLINGLSTPRGMIIDSLGSALVVESGRGVRFIKLTSDTGLNICVSSSKTLISDTSVRYPFLSFVKKEPKADYIAKSWHRTLRRRQNPFRLQPNNRLQLHLRSQQRHREQQTDDYHWYGRWRPRYAHSHSSQEIQSRCSPRASRLKCQQRHTRYGRELWTCTDPVFQCI